MLVLVDEYNFMIKRGRLWERNIMFRLICRLSTFITKKTQTKNESPTLACENNLFDINLRCIR